MTALSLMAKPGATLRWGVPLAGGLLPNPNPITLTLTLTLSP